MFFLCLQKISCVFPAWKSKNQIPWFPCVVATLQITAVPLSVNGPLDLSSFDKGHIDTLRVNLFPLPPPAGDCVQAVDVKYMIFLVKK